MSALPHQFCPVCGASNGMHYGACTGDVEAAARAEEVSGNVDIANGGDGRRFFRRADSIRRRAAGRDAENVWRLREFQDHKDCPDGDCKWEVKSQRCVNGEITDPRPSDTTVPTIGDPVSHDLYREGDSACDHEFRPWEVSSGVIDRNREVVAQMFFEAACRFCDARVGRKIETVIHDNRR